MARGTERVHVACNSCMTKSNIKDVYAHD